MPGDIPPLDEALLGQFIDDYFAECDEHLSAVRAHLLTLESAIGQPQISRSLLDNLLRAFHSIKGLSGMVGVVPAEELAHEVEGRLRRLQQGTVRLTPALYDAFVAATQVMEAVIGARRAGQPLPDIAGAVARLREASPEPGPAVASGLDPEQAAQLSAALEEGGRAWRFEFTSAPALAARGVTVNAVRARLQEIGQVIRVTPRVKEGGGVAFDFLVVSHAGPEAFAGWESDGIAFALDTSNGSTPAAPAPPAAGGEQPEPVGLMPANFVRVDLARLDDLMQQVGELVIGRARLAETLRSLEPYLPVAGQRALQESSLALERGLRDLRAAAMRVRLVPIGEVFARMQFVVRDLARAGQKQVLLEIAGQETEIDKLVVERMMDPLLHLVRNAVSHGIEPPAERAARGKPPAGRIALRAATAGDMVVIQVQDDGRGVDAGAVAAQARALGLLGADQALDSERLLEILCAPGFSTRPQADLASGRGVGMAVVYDAVRALGGSLALTTGPGRGSQFTIQLPLTLAIVDSLIVDAGGQTFAVPQLALREVIEIGAGALRALENNEIVYHRGAALPVLRLARLFGLPAQAGPRLYGLVVGSGAKAVALAVDRLRGQREIVVGSITDPLIRVPGVAGATQLGDGRVILILDPAALVQADHQRTSSSVAR